MNKGKDDDDATLTEEYKRRAVQITVFTFLHTRVFKANKLTRPSHRAWESPNLEHMSQGRILWLEAFTHNDVDLDIFNLHQTTAGRFDLQQLASNHLIVMIEARKGKCRLMGGDFNAATSYVKITTIVFKKSTSISRTLLNRRKVN